METHSQVVAFLQKFNTHYYQTHPSELKPSKLLELVQELTILNFQKNKASNVLGFDQIETLLSQKLQVSKNSAAKNCILVIGAPGVGKTAFMKYYAKRHNKIPIYISCCELASLLKQQAPQTIDLLFEMNNFSDETLLYFDQIDILFNQDYQFQQIAKAKDAMLKNLNNKQHKASVIFSTNRPWKIQNKQLLHHINYAIEIPVLDQEKRKIFIEMVIKQIKDFKIQNFDINKLVKYTENFINSDIYCLIKQIPWERLRQMIQQSQGKIQDIEHSQIVANQKHVERAMKNMKPSLQVKQIKQFTQWRKKFNKSHKE